MTKHEQKLSRFLSLILRHDPSVVGLEQNRKSISLKNLQAIVNENSKRRFHFSDDGTRIRAAQGHSVEVDLQFIEQAPPDILYHGTATRYMGRIEREGLSKMSRQHVHLSPDIRTAHSVGEHHGKPVILEVASGLMYSHKHQFYLSENGVWLTGHVPPDYLNRRFTIS